MTEEPRKDPPTRRGMLAGVGLAGLAGAVTACGAGSPGSPSPATGDGAGGTGGGQAASALATTKEIPVGGGKIFSAQQVVVTQPTVGSFKCFSAVCTHRGCLVNLISNGTIDCPCHGSQYSIENGAVLAGPAPRPLPAEQIKISGGKIFLE